jgi:glycosyltransferase involved in cell wall biosynthesis
MSWESGIWFHRNHLPSIALQNRGHEVKFMSVGGTTPKELMEYPDTVIFGRTYHPSANPLVLMREFKNGKKRVIYDLDDDFWSVNPDNPSVLVSSAYKDQYEDFIREADACITPSPILADKMRKLVRGKKVFICPNMINTEFYTRRSDDKDELIVGYMGAASHWKDLEIIGDVIPDLQKKHKFLFVLYGMTGNPLEGEMYKYTRILWQGLQPEKAAYLQGALDWYKKVKGLDMVHVPFYPPELHPYKLRECDFDIGIAPLYDCEFNRGKSNIKFYEYAAVGTVTLASDVLPYKEEVNYRAKNTYKDWYSKLEKLIVDKDFREKTLQQQRKWVLENRTTTQVGLSWEKACQREGGLPVLNQKSMPSTTTPSSQMP